ncbi:MAG: hypothetical protein M1818_003785 [Claussenomyces sp. TS43310]|nr:MAG: hypothetical protein M1818_003785 [Claussenomyces sp. TS43310]
MPRPKRTKVPLAGPTPRVTKPTTIIPRTTIDSSDDIYGISDPDERRTSNAKRTRQRKPRPEDQKRQIWRATSGMTAARESTLNDRKQERDLAMGRLEAENFTSTAGSDIPLASTEQDSSSPPMEVGRRAEQTSLENAVFGIGNFGRRARRPSILGPGRAARSSSVETDLADGTGLVHAPKADNSILPVGGLRRRARQPSILGNRASRLRSSSLGLDVANTPNVSSHKTGLFQRRTRQPSILGTAQKNNRQQEEKEKEEEEEEEEEGEYDLEDNEDEFDPEDESTPLNRSKTSVLTEQSLPPTSSITNPRKRKLTSPQGPRSSSPLPAQDEDEAASEEIIPSTELPDNGSQQDSAIITTPEPLSETMAPPQSTSPLPRQVSELPQTFRRQVRPPSVPLATRRNTSRRRATPPDESPPSSPPSLTHSPNLRPTTKAAAKRKRPVPDPATFSTAELQALLPRRRHRAARDPLAFESEDESQVDTTGLGSDDDELTHLSVTARRSTRRTLAPMASTRSVTKFQSSKKGKNMADERKTSKRIYGARTAESDKENNRNTAEPDEEQDLDDSLAPVQDAGDESPENSQALEARVGKELKRAKRKFEAVDKWELEFEEVTASSSSPWDAR